jgi:CRP-like cAMP-binding protein
MDGQAQSRMAEIFSRAADEAANSLQAALGAGDMPARMELAELLARAGKPGPAISQLQAIAGHHATQGELLKALAVAKAISALDPNHRETLEALADLYAVQQSIGPDGSWVPASMATAPGKASEAPSPLDLRVCAFFVPGLLAHAKTGAAASAPEPHQLTRFDGEIPNAPIFSTLDRDSFFALAECLRPRWVRPREIVAAAGDAADTMFFVVEGSLRIGSDPAHGALLEPGNTFGEKALMGEAPRSATVTAATDGLLFSLSRSALAALDAGHPEVRIAINDLFRERLLANLLEVSPLFRSVAPEAKRQLSSRFGIRDLGPGVPLLQQGRQGSGFFVLMRGACDVFHTGPDGVKHSYPAMKPGDVFGEISLLFDSPCTATVQSQSSCEVLELLRQDFTELLMPNAEVKGQIIALAQERLNRTAAHSTDSNGEVASSWIV